MTKDAAAKLAVELRSQGVTAYTDDKYLPDRGPQFGLSVDGYFYPLWELNQEGNEDPTCTTDFEAIRKKRPPNWTYAFNYS